MGLESDSRVADITGIRKAIPVSVGLVALLGACALPPVGPPAATVHPRLEVLSADRLPVNIPIAITFDRPVNPAFVRPTITPIAGTQLSWFNSRLVIAPTDQWGTGTDYTVAIAAFHDSTRNLELKGWQAHFRTQPSLGVAGFMINGRDVSDGAVSTPGSSLTIRFPESMQPSTVALTAGGQPIASTMMQWGEDRTSVSLSMAQFPLNQSLAISVQAGLSDLGDVLTMPASIELRLAIVEPSNAASGITPEFLTKTPIEVVIENSPPARPQSGLQQADMVFEYISEYSVTRMTAIYFNNPPALMGPVRSCRLINVPLNEAFYGATMCSGVSPGTHAQLPTGDNPRKMHVIINDYDRGNHFFRVGFRFAPHNLFTDAARALRWRAEESLPAPTYVIDPPHPDNGLGIPTGPPTVGLHSVSYAYSPATQTYVRFDHGSRFVDAATNAQLQVKNVILMHTYYQVMGYLEDYSGGAHSVYYGLIGSGPAEIWSDGRLVHATWHMDLLTPPYFTDDQGNFVELNTGLTWIHVLGNGQTH